MEGGGRRVAARASNAGAATFLGDIGILGDEDDTTGT